MDEQVVGVLISLANMSSLRGTLLPRQEDKARVDNFYHGCQGEIAEMSSRLEEYVDNEGGLLDRYVNKVVNVHRSVCRA